VGHFEQQPERYYRVEEGEGGNNHHWYVWAPLGSIEVGDLFTPNGDASPTHEVTSIDGGFVFVRKLSAELSPA